MPKKGFKKHYDARPTSPSYIAEPDWRGLERMHQENYDREQVANSIREDYFRQKFKLPTEDERVAIIQSQAKLQQVQQKAQFDAANFEKRYTAKQKAEISKLSAIDAEIDSNPNFTESEKIAAHRAVQMKKLGIVPSDLPRLSPFPQGQGVGDTWNVDGVGMVTRIPDGGIKIIQGWKDSAQAQSAKDAHEIEKQQLKLQAEREKKISDYVIKYATEDVVEGETVRKHTAQEVRDYFQQLRGSTSRQEGMSTQDVMKQRQFAGIENEDEARRRIANQRAEAGLPPVASAAEQVGGQEFGGTNIGEGSATGELQRMRGAGAKQETRLKMMEEARSIISDAIANPEKMKDATFSAKARAARRYLGQE